MDKRKNSWQCGMIVGADSEGCFIWALVQIFTTWHAGWFKTLFQTEEKGNMKDKSEADI